MTASPPSPASPTSASPSLASPSLASPSLASPALKFSVITFGCKVNQYESSALTESLLKNGYAQAEDPGKADIIVVNSCAVTEKAAAEARRLVRSLRRKRPEAAIVATGCLAQIEPETLFGPKMADLVLGQFEKANLAAHLAGHLASNLAANVSARVCASEKPKEGAVVVSERETAISDLGHPKSNKTRVFHKIQDGCSAGCAYCAVPLARGRSRSAPLEKVFGQLAAYLERGAKEIVLAGIHLGHWGLDLSPPLNLRILLDSIEERFGSSLEGARFRLSSLEPLEIALVEKKLRDRSWLVPHLHSPIQSGSDKILKAMGRPYEAAEAERFLLELKDAIPDLHIGSDILCGFPGESEADFEETLKLIERIPFARLHVFPFSPRKGTRAAGFPDQVPEAIKRGRMRILRELASKKAAAFLSSQIGKTRPALIEGLSPKTGRATALTDNFIRAVLPLESRVRQGEIREIAIWGSSGDPMLAEADLAEPFDLAESQALEARSLPLAAAET